MTAAERSYHRRFMHWCINHAKDIEVEHQGGRFTVRHRGPPVKPGRVGIKLPMCGLSDKSRLNALKHLAALNWTAARPGVFITLTYPDEVLDREPDYHQDRAVFWRYIENHLGREKCAFWRVEWKDRLTGKYKGKFCPHHHFIVPKLNWIDKDIVNGFWKMTLRYKEFCVSGTERIRSEQHVQAYIGKYAAKQDSSLLVFATYHNKLPNGRHWGMLRKELLPWTALRTKVMSRDWRIDRLERWAAGKLKIENGLRNCGFTLLGKNAEVAGEWFFGHEDCKQ